MRILHLSDTHLFADPAGRHYDRIDTAAALRGILQRLSDLDGVDLLVHSGDASEDGSAQSYRLLHELLDPVAKRLGAPLVVAMGNHDVPSAYAEVAGPGDHLAPYQDRIRVTGDGLRTIVLDTSVPGAGYGHLDPEQFEWLSQVLSAPAPRGTVLVMHHPSLPASTPLLAALDLDGLDDLAATLRGSDVRVILSGHYHHGLDGDFAGIPVHVVPGVTNVVDPLGAGEREQALPLSGASLLEIDEEYLGAAPRITTSLWPNAGDTASAPEIPVYDFDAGTVRAIIDAAGRRIADG